MTAETDGTVQSTPTAPTLNIIPLWVMALYCMGLAFLTIGTFALFGAWGYIVVGSGMIFLSLFAVYLVVTPVPEMRVWNA